MQTKIQVEKTKEVDFSVQESTFCTFALMYSYLKSRCLIRQSCRENYTISKAFLKFLLLQLQRRGFEVNITKDLKPFLSYYCSILYLKNLSLLSDLVFEVVFIQTYTLKLEAAKNFMLLNRDTYLFKVINLI